MSYPISLSHKILSQSVKYFDNQLYGNLKINDKNTLDIEKQIY